MITVPRNDGQAYKRRSAAGSDTARRVKATEVERSISWEQTQRKDGEKTRGNANQYQATKNRQC